MESDGLFVFVDLYTFIILTDTSVLY